MVTFMSGIGGIIVIILLIAVDFVPFIIAVMRKHNDTLAVFVVNLPLGWTVIGWIAALIWSLTGNVKQRAA